MTTMNLSFLGTPEQLRKQYAANAHELCKMAAKAQATGRKVGGYTLEQLEEMIAEARTNAVSYSV